MEQELIKIVEKKIDKYLKKEICKEAYLCVESLSYDFQFDQYYIDYRVGVVEKWQHNDTYFIKEFNIDILYGSIIGYLEGKNII